MTAALTLPTAIKADAAQTASFIEWHFEYVDWPEGGIISILGIGEKGTRQDGKFRDRKFIRPEETSLIAMHSERWGQHDIATFFVPAVIHGSAQHTGDVAADKIKAFTSIVVDLDCGDIAAKAAYVARCLGEPSMVVRSGGVTAEGQDKLHLWYRLTEPSEETDRIAAARKLLAAKVGGDQAFGRKTQVVRVPGSLHGKGGVQRLVEIISGSGIDYDLDELIEAIELMDAMQGFEARARSAEIIQLPTLTTDGMMDFSNSAGRSTNPMAEAAAGVVHEAGVDGVTRFEVFNSVAGAEIRRARRGGQTLAQAEELAWGWMQGHMSPPWDRLAFRARWSALVALDAKNYPDPVVRAFEPPLSAQGDGELPVEFFSDIQPSLTNAELVRGLIPQSGLVAVGGQPGSGKTFLVSDIAMRIAANMDVANRAVVPGPVVYVVAEGQGGFRKRVAAFRQHHRITEDLPFAIVPMAIDLLKPGADLPRLVAAIGRETERLGGHPVLIVVDTLAATFGGGDENTKDMVAYVNNLATMRDRFSATVLVVHHLPKDENNKTLRGHGSLAGAMDTIIMAGFGKGGVHVAAATKQKDAELGLPLNFDLLSVTLGNDEEGEEVTSAVVTYRHYRPSRAKLAKGPSDALSALEACIASGGQVNADTAQAGWHGASVGGAEWRNACGQVGLGGDSYEARRKAFGRARKALIEAGRIGEMGDRFWPIPEVDQADLSCPTSPMDFSSGAGL